MESGADRSAVNVTETAPPRTKVRRKSVGREYAEAIIMAVVLVLVVRTFVFQAFRIPTGSMEDTLLVGDFLFVNKFIYGAHVPFTDWQLPAVRSPRRGDIIVFKFPKDPSRDFIKRVIGEPGDTVEISNKVISINGEPIREPYAKYTATRRRPQNYQSPQISPPGAGNRDFYGPVVVPEGKFLVLGDNRDNSDDGRFWGYLDRKLILGRAEVIYFSVDTRHKSLRLSRIGDLIR